MNNIKPYTYLIKFLPTGQIYYGVRVRNVKLGLFPEEDLMIKYFTSCKPLQKLIKEYGLESFAWEVRKIFDTSEQASKWEQTVLRRCKSVSNPLWFNQNACGFIIPTPEGLQKISDFHKDKPKSEEHKANISKALKGKKKTAEHQMNINKNLPDNSGENNGMFGKIQKEATRLAIGAGNKNKVRTEENKLKLSKAGTGKKTVNNGLENKVIHKDELIEFLQSNIGWVKGRLLSNETRQLFSDNQRKTHLGVKRSKTTKDKQSKSAKGKIKSEDHCANISKALTGKKRTGNIAKGESCAKAVLTSFQVLEIRSKYATGHYNQKELALEYKISRVGIHNIIHRKTWRHI